MVAQIVKESGWSFLHQICWICVRGGGGRIGGCWLCGNQIQHHHHHQSGHRGQNFGKPKAIGFHYIANL